MKSDWIKTASTCAGVVSAAVCYRCPLLFSIRHVVETVKQFGLMILNVSCSAFVELLSDLLLCVGGKNQLGNWKEIFNSQHAAFLRWCPTASANMMWLHVSMGRLRLNAFSFLCAPIIDVLSCVCTPLHIFFFLITAAPLSVQIFVKVLLPDSVIPLFIQTMDAFSLKQH